MHGGAAQLGDEQVGVLLGHDLTARLGERSQRDLVRHRRGRDEDRFLLAEQLRGAALELVDRGVLAPLLVTDLGGRDRRAHLRRRLGLGVRAEVDHHAPFGAFHDCRRRGLAREIGVLLEAVADDDAFRGLHLVQPAHRPAMRRALQLLGLLGGLTRNREHRVREGVQRLLRLGLGRLDHQRLGHDEREVDGRRMEVVVHQPLGDVGRRDAVLTLERPSREHELVHAEPVIRQLVGIPQPREQVVRVQDRNLRHLSQPRPVGEDEGVRADEDAEGPVEAAHLADRLGPVVVEAVAVVLAHDRRHRQKRLEPLRHRDRPPARAAAAVRLREGLVQVDVDDVEAHVAGPRDPADRVEIRAVVVHERADAVEDPGDLLDVLVEEPQRRRVRQHEPRGVLVDLSAQVLDVDVAPGVGLDRRELVPGHRHARRVRPVRGVGYDDLPALLVLASICEVGAHQHQAGELALGAGRRLQGDGVEPGDLGEHLLELPAKRSAPCAPSAS